MHLEPVRLLLQRQQEKDLNIRLGQTRRNDQSILHGPRSHLLSQHGVTGQTMVRAGLRSGRRPLIDNKVATTDHHHRHRRGHIVHLPPVVPDLLVRWTEGVHKVEAVLPHLPEVVLGLLQAQEVHQEVLQARGEIKRKERKSKYTEGGGLGLSTLFS